MGEHREIGEPKVGDREIDRGLGQRDGGRERGTAQQCRLVRGGGMCRARERQERRSGELSTGTCCVWGAQGFL